MVLHDKWQWINCRHSPSGATEPLSPLDKGDNGGSPWDQTYSLCSSEEKKKRTEHSIKHSGPVWLWPFRIPPLFLTWWKQTCYCDFAPGFAGTPGYLSPEVLRKDPYGKPVDMWACGGYCSLYHSMHITLVWSTQLAFRRSEKSRQTYVTDPCNRQEEWQLHSLSQEIHTSSHQHALHL